MCIIIKQLHTLHGHLDIIKYSNMAHHRNIYSFNPHDVFQERVNRVLNQITVIQQNRQRVNTIQDENIQNVNIDNPQITQQIESTQTCDTDPSPPS